MEHLQHHYRSNQQSFRTVSFKYFRIEVLVTKQIYQIDITKVRRASHHSANLGFPQVTVDSRKQNDPRIKWRP